MIEVSEKVLSYIENIYGKNSSKLYLDFINSDPTQYIRANSLKIERTKLAKIIRDNYGIETETIPSLPNSLKILSKSEFVSRSIEHIIGLYYIQGLSSMLPPLVLNPLPNDIVLDLCSAPGSKTTELAELMNNNGTLIANEIQLDRVKMLVYNLDRMNIINTGVVHSKGEMLSKIYEEHFDKILVDAPCSGLGIIQKKGEVSNWWSLDRAERLGDLQTRLLIAAIKMLKVGGEVVYSTCTLTIEENELVLNTILNKYPVEAIEMDLPVKSHEAFTSFKDKSLNQNLSLAKRIFPWEVDSDGFFIIKLRKTGSTSSPDKIIPKKRDLKFVDIKNKNLRKTFSNLKDDFGLGEDSFSNYNFLIKGNDIFFVTKAWADNNLGLFERIGTKFGSIDNKGQTVLHTNAAQFFQNEITKNIFNVEEQDDLKKYLEGGIIKKDFGSPGQCVIKYQDYILGTAVNTKQGIKSRFPRAKRTQEILI